jgi:hypothetical protein
MSSQCLSFPFTHLDRRGIEKSISEGGTRVWYCAASLPAHAGSTNDDTALIADVDDDDDDEDDPGEEDALLPPPPADADVDVDAARILGRRSRHDHDGILTRNFIL